MAVDLRRFRRGRWADMHGSVLTWTYETVDETDVAGLDVLEVGSFNVNGSVRPIVEEHGPASYVGVDRVAGPGVDMVVDAERLTEVLGRDCCDVLISTEMLEHCDDWQQCVREMVAAVRPGGLLVVTTRSVGFAYHCPPDVWRYSWDALLDVFEYRAGLRVEVLIRDPEAPGVFVRARKPEDWVGWVDGNLDQVEGVTPMFQ